VDLPANRAEPAAPHLSILVEILFLYLVGDAVVVFDVHDCCKLLIELPAPVILKQ
jgi:hypothetical protein